MFPRLFVTVALLIVALAGAASAAFFAPGMESLKDRSMQGGTTVVLPEPNPRPCQAACLAMEGCTAWTYVEPGMKAITPASCILTKGPRPAGQLNSCCISGLRPEAVQSFKTLRQNTDLPGSDYSDFGIPGGVLAKEQEHKICSAACRIDPECKGWTYVKPGVEAEHGRCWLKKDPRPNPLADANYTSGW